MNQEEPGERQGAGRDDPEGWEGNGGGAVRLINITNAGTLL